MHSFSMCKITGCIEIQDVKIKGSVCAFSYNACTSDTLKWCASHQPFHCPEDLNIKSVKEKYSVYSAILKAVKPIIFAYFWYTKIIYM